MDVVLAGGEVVDGSGAPAYRADVGLEGGMIAAIGDLSATPTALRLDISGYTVTPGFIDPHTHSDLALLLNPEAHSKVRQGVTTEVIGNCGSSPAPLVGPHAADVKARFGAPAPVERAKRATGEGVSSGGGGGLPWQESWTWQTFGEYLDHLDDARPAVNVVPLAGHVTLRSAAMGFDFRPPSGAEQAGMEALLEEALGAGAYGMSSGLMTPPSSYADTEELVALARVLRRHEGLYFSHIRGEGETLFRATAEAIEIGERAGVPVQIAHHKAAFRPNWGRMPNVTRLSEWAADRGVDVRFDVYPYTAGSAGLTQLIPDWAHEGGREALLGRLREPQSRARLREEVLAFGREWERIYVTTVNTEANRPLEGKTLAEIGEQRHAAPVDVLFDLLLEEGGRAGMLHFIMDEGDVEHVLKHPLSMIGSDGSSLRPDGPLGRGKPHPRSYGCFPRVLAHYVRERRLLSLEEAVRKMTSAPATRLGLKGKGLLRWGMDADLVVFDPLTVRDAATFAEPHRYAEGVRHVIVDGTLTVRDGEHTGSRAGRVLRRG